MWSMVKLEIFLIPKNKFLNKIFVILLATDKCFERKVVENKKALCRKFAEGVFQNYAIVWRSGPLSEEPCLANDEVFSKTFIELGIIRMLIHDVFSNGFKQLDFILCLQRENDLLENYVFKSIFNRCFLDLDNRICKQLPFCEFLMDHESCSVSYQVPWRPLRPI